ncbi:MAG TPA: ferritin-like domain-containing protein [Polyangiaceae bacterium]|nr:ferritin-like domain-containing protein [Polyangiaceae bacterium]
MSALVSLDPGSAEIVRTRVAGTWAFRTRAEIEASARFARMATDLAEVGASPVVVQGAAEASADERRHRDLCARLAAAWGEPHALNHEPPRQRIGRSDMDPRDRVLWEMVAVCCISETMNTSLMTRCMEVVREEDIRATLHELLEDEVRHARLGWAHLAAERAQGRGQFLGDVLPLMLEASVEPGFLDGTAPVPWTEALYDYGELPWAELVRIYRDTLNLVIFPGLDATGVDTKKGRAWLAEHSPG